jgi:hypothetical protein
VDVDDAATAAQVVQERFFDTGLEDASNQQH